MKLFTEMTPLLWRAVMAVSAGILLSIVSSQALAQRIEGELEIHVLGGNNATILVQSQGSAFATQCSWYQDDPDIRNWGKENTTVYRLQFVDRNITCSPYSLPDTPRFGYGKYKVSVGSAFIYVDFRDADYGTLTGYSGQDMWLYYTPGSDFFWDEYNEREIPLEDTYGIWDMYPKQTGRKIPLTVRNDFGTGYGSTVAVDGTWQNSPYKVKMTEGSHSVEAHVSVVYNGSEYTFSHWSDGGGRYHTISVDRDDFAQTLTAYYTQSKRQSEETQTLAQLSAAAYPNPFNPTTMLRFSLPSRCHVRLTIFDKLGRQVVKLVDGYRDRGDHQVKFDGTGLPSGTYFYRLHAGGRTISRALMLLK